MIKKKTVTTEIVIPEPDIKSMKVTIKGTTPLIFNKWSEKAKMQIREKQRMAAKTGRGVREPDSEYLGTFYLTQEQFIAFPALCIKQAIVSTARVLPELTMTQLRAGLFVAGDIDGLIPVLHKGKTLKVNKLQDAEGKYGENVYKVDVRLPEVIQMREDMVRLMGGGASDLRYRGQVKDWTMEFIVKWNGGMFSASQVLNLIQYAGFSSGLGEWRMERSGTFGAFELQK